MRKCLQHFYLFFFKYKLTFSNNTSVKCQLNMSAGQRSSETTTDQIVKCSRSHAKPNSILSITPFKSKLETRTLHFQPYF